LGEFGGGEAFHAGAGGVVNSCSKTNILSIFHGLDTVPMHMMLNIMQMLKSILS
jgi:hypothetical protein